ncbi:MAG TPA: hypothetical protein VHX60_17280 [Acidobacteriaceae bacterium]|jgi:hypothetical protein|nr:hypothetical protein [Acidobacteriaceae bacterium]
MIRAYAVAKWVGLFLLEVVVFKFGTGLIRSIVQTCARLADRSGANLGLAVLIKHFLIVQFACGLAAGVAGLALLRIVFLRINADAPLAPSPWRRPQAWVCVLYTIHFFRGVSDWIATNTHHSVVANFPNPGVSDFFRTFFGSGCDPTNKDLLAMLTNGNACPLQVHFSAVWLAAIGYSLATFLPEGWGAHTWNKFLMVMKPEQFDAAPDPNAIPTEPHKSLL